MKTGVYSGTIAAMSAARFDSQSASKSASEQGECSATQPSKGCQASQATAKRSVSTAAETGGPAGLEPTRYGDWERKGRCIDF